MRPPETYIHEYLKLYVGSNLAHRLYLIDFNQQKSANAATGDKKIKVKPLP